MLVIRILASGLAGAVAWWAGIAAVFGPAQTVLADPSRQSEKFLAAFTEPPLPRMADEPWVLIAGIGVIAIIHAGVFAWLEGKLPGGVIRRGLTFGVIAWALMAPWFEFYLPWNVMREPLALVMVEMGCWLGVQLLVGLAIAWASGLIGRYAKRPV